MESNTIQFSVSNKGLVCRDIIKTLKDCKITSSVSKNKSIYCNSKNICHVENGCRIIVGNMTKEKTLKLWDIIKKKHNFNCCYLKVDNIFSGCINDYI
tara:strand:- start:339 stop:632 length:294 start_codon:yes stop_codon:yes gene_type:complete